MATRPPSPDYSSAAQRLLYGATSRKLPLEPLLAKAGIDPASLDDPHQRLRGQQYLRLLRTVNTELGDEFFGLSRRPSKRGTFAMMAKTGLHCETLKAFIEHCCEFYRLTTDDLEFVFSQEGDVATLSLRQSELEFDPDQFLAEYWLLHLHRMFSWMTGFMIPLLAVNFTSGEEPGPHRLIYYLRSDWQPGQAANSFVFHAKYLSLPVVKTLPELKEHMSPDVDRAPIWPDDVLTWSQGAPQADLRQPPATGGHQPGGRQPVHHQPQPAPPFAGRRHHLPATAGRNAPRPGHREASLPAPVGNRRG